MPPSSNHVLLASMTYEPSLPNHIQTFPVSPQVVALNIDVGIVVVKVLNNWGGDYSCLYRVSVTEIHAVVPD